MKTTPEDLEIITEYKQAKSNFNDSVKELNVREIFSSQSRLQRYLDVEAALAITQAKLGLIPQSAGEKIAMKSKIELIDEKRLEAEQAITGHFMMPLVSELSRLVGQPEGGYVHWGATTQNIEQTGDILGIRSATDILTKQICDVLEALAKKCRHFNGRAYSLAASCTYHFWL